MTINHYFTLSLDQKTFSIIGSTQKPEKRHSAISILQTIEKVLREDYQYLSTFPDDHRLAHLTQTESIQLLKSKALEIHNRYIQKQSELCWLWRKIFSKENQVETVYKRIANLTPPTKDALPISNDCIPYVLQFLPIADLGNFGQLNRHAKEHADLALQAIACRLGCKDDGISLAKKYLKDLCANLQFLSKQDWRYGPGNKFFIRDLIQRDHRGKLLIKESLIHLKLLTINDLAKLFSHNAPLYLLRREILAPQIPTGEVFIDKKSANLALFYAVLNKEFEVVRFLLWHGAKADLTYSDRQHSPPKDRTLLYLSINKKTPLITELLLKNKASISPKLLSYAARLPDNQENIKLLLEYDANASQLDKDLAMFTAIKNKNLSNVQTLVEEGIKHDEVNFKELLSIAVDDGNAEIIKLIIKIATTSDKVIWGSDIYSSPFFRAIANKDIEKVLAFIEGGIDLNHADEHGRTALQQATCDGTPEIIELLIKHGADPNLKDKIGQTPPDLHLG